MNIVSLCSYSQLSTSKILYTFKNVLCRIDSLSFVGIISRSDFKLNTLYVLPKFFPVALKFFNINIFKHRGKLRSSVATVQCVHGCLIGFIAFLFVPCGERWVMVSVSDELFGRFGDRSVCLTC